MAQVANGTVQVDRFGNPIDGSVGYARGSILGSSADEIARTMFSRRVIREKILSQGDDAVFNCSGLPRVYPLDPEDLPKLRSQLTFYAYFDGTAEETAIRFMGGDPQGLAALFVTRVTAGILAIAMALVGKGDVVLSLVPKGRSHPSIQRSVELIGGSFVEAIGIEAFEAALREGQPKLVVVTPITPAKYHLPVPDLVRSVELGRKAGAVVFVDDAHMAARTAFFGDPLPFECAPIDVAILSTDKHIMGPRGGVIVARKELMTGIRSRAMEFGLEAQSGHYAAMGRALEKHQVEPIKRAGEMAWEVLSRLEQRYGKGRFYIAGPGVSISADDALALAVELSGKSKPAIVPIEAATVICNHMLQEHGVVTVTSVGMPGAAPMVRTMMFPDGLRLGLEGVMAALEGGIARLQEVLDQPEAARRVIMGPEGRP